MVYKVKTEVYEGPFDLLLDLISKQKLDIYDISLGQITTEYLAYLKELKKLDLEPVSEFLLVAAILLELKVSALLDEEEEKMVPLPETKPLLAARLWEYKKFKNAAFYLARKQAKEGKFFPAEALVEERFSKLSPNFLEKFSLQDLAQTFIALLVRKSLLKEPPPVVSVPLRVEEKIDFVLQRLKVFGSQTFRVLTQDFEDKIEVITAFLALLELYKQGQILLSQKDAFGEIRIEFPEGR